MKTSRALASLAVLAGVAAALPLAAAGPAAPPPASPAANTSVDRGALDAKVSPCDDFYRYACGGWLASHPIPPDYPVWGRFGELHDRNQAALRAILEKDAADDPGRTPVQRQVGDFYAACMDETGREATGLAPLQDDLDRIASLTGREGLPELVARLHRQHVDVLFNLSSSQDFADATQVIAAVDQGGLGLPERGYYLKDDAKSVEQRDLYRRHVARMLALAGEPAGGSESKAEAEAAAVVRFETGIAQASLDLVSRRDPRALDHKLAVKDLQALTPGFAWDRYLAAMPIPPTATLNVAVPDFFRGLDALVAKTDLATLRAYLRWHLVHGARLPPRAFVDESFAFYGKVLYGSKELSPLWKRCVQAADRYLGEALGQEFVAASFGPQAKERTRAMVAALEAALGRDIATLPWMTPATRAAAAAKLRVVANKIGYPDRWRDYGALRIDRHDALGNGVRGEAFEVARQLGKIGRPVDRGEWEITPPTVDAYYSPSMNDINFPAGILQPPFYGSTRDDAVNFGAIGAVIGHELTHGFDDEGRRFAGNGDLRDWWTPADGREFDRRAGCVADQYSGYTAIGDVKVNGRLTLGENVADNGGLRIAYLALEESLKGKPAGQVDGFTPEQRFFLGFGQIWCESASPQFERLHALTNEHSPGRYRVDGAVSNMPEFQQAFQCQAGAPMAPATRCRVW